MKARLIYLKAWTKHFGVIKTNVIRPKKRIDIYSFKPYLKK